MKVSKRVFDLCVLFTMLPVLLPISLFCVCLVRLSSKGPVLFWSTRIGRYGREFQMPKFRTMVIEAPLLETNSMRSEDIERLITKPGAFLRRYSLDEIPQLWSVLRGEMSLVGYRPALPSQSDLNRGRETLGVHAFRPGITGLAQVNGRDQLGNYEKLMFDHTYVQSWSLVLDIKILLATVRHVVLASGVSH